MSEITIGRRSQGVMLLTLIAVVGAALCSQLPEIKRYLRVRAMS